MKKNWLAILMLLALAAPILYAVTARQLYRVDYDATRDGNTYTYVDQMRVGVSTATGRQYVIFYGTGSIFLKGFNTSVEITTAGIKINGIAVSTGGASDYDAMYLRISSGPTLEAMDKSKLAASSSTVLEGLINGRLAASTGTIIEGLLADSFPILFTSTDTTAGCGVCPATVTYRLPGTWTMTASRIFANDITGSVTIVVSTGDTVAGTWVVISSGDAMSATTQYYSGLEHWVGSRTIPAGKLIRFYVGGAPSATQSATYQLDFKR